MCVGTPKGLTRGYQEKVSTSSCTVVLNFVNVTVITFVLNFGNKSRTQSIVAAEALLVLHAVVRPVRYQHLPECSLRVIGHRVVQSRVALTVLVVNVGSAPEQHLADW